MNSWLAWGALATAYLVLGIIVWRFIFRAKQDEREPIPMPPDTNPGIQVATDAILDAAERDQDVIDAAKDPRAAAKLAAIRRGRR